MELSIKTILIVCPLVFLAGFVDAIGGGGGLISLPAYLLAGIPAHSAIATNKLSSTSGTIFSTYRYFKKGFRDLKLAVPGIIMALIGAQIGARFALMVDDQAFKIILMVALPFIAIYTLMRKDLKPSGEDIPMSRKYLLVIIISLCTGIYDGFYGPGTGTFLILLYTGLVKMDVLVASGNAKLVNLASNVSALSAYLLSGNVLIPLGLMASFFSIAGHLSGSSLAIKKGGSITRYIIIAVIILLTIKLVMEIL